MIWLIVIITKSAFQPIFVITTALTVWIMSINVGSRLELHTVGYSSITLMVSEISPAYDVLEKRKLRLFYRS